MTDNSEIQEFGGPWTAIKVEILKKYLIAYTTALKNKPTTHNPFKLIYIDAFAGAGKYRPKQKPVAERLFEIPYCDKTPIKSGSAKTALEIPIPFHEYHFIDNDKNNIRHLCDLKNNYPHLVYKIHIHPGDAAQHIQEICSKTDWRMKRAVLFIDPFKIDVSWETIKTIGSAGTIDMWFLFPISAVNRMLTKSGIISTQWQEKLSDVFGSNCWKDAFYPSSGQMCLPGMEASVNKKNTDFEGIKQYIIIRLKTIFAGVSPNPRILRNSTNSPLFILFFAVGNQRGKDVALNIANNILKNT